MTQVVFTCAIKNQVSDVSEPELCHYLLQFETSLVCQKQSMFVYPYLSSELKDAWDVIEGELLRKELTQKVSVYRYVPSFLVYNVYS